MRLPIKRGIERIPGGMVIVPLSLGALIATFAPGTAGFFGSFTGALFTGALPILAVFYVCMGATIPFETLPQVAVLQQPLPSRSTIRRPRSQVFRRPVSPPEAPPLP